MLWGARFAAGCTRYVVRDRQTGVFYKKSFITKHVTHALVQILLSGGVDLRPIYGNVISLCEIKKTLFKKCEGG